MTKHPSCQTLIYFFFRIRIVKFIQKIICLGNGFVAQLNFSVKSMGK